MAKNNPINDLRSRAADLGRGNVVGLKDLYFYLVPVFASIAAAASDSKVLQIDLDSDFYWIGTSYYAAISDAVYTESATPIPQLLVNFRDQGSGRNLMNTPVPLASVAGYGREMYYNPIERLMRANTSMTVNLENYSTASTYTDIYIVLHGRKEFLQR